ncbi:MAG: type II toxin-antitoxin system RelE/ParE family toxin [Gemmatimonadaceae bacterium]|nr:type II toxin-antitoxin system RelE/ParE family toxin [Gemmatimonadaceae bacterium]
MKRPPRKYEVTFANSAARALKKIDPEFQRRIFRRIDALALDPRPHDVKQLSAPERLFRVRVNDYRIIYQIKDEILIVLVVSIGHRREVYR